MQAETPKLIYALNIATPQTSALDPCQIQMYTSLSTNSVIVRSAMLDN